MPDDLSGPLRVDFVTGVTPDKWARTWRDRSPDDVLDLSPIDEDDAVARLRSGVTTLSLLRLPIDQDGLHVIPLYEEAPVVVVAKEHVAAAFDTLDITALADEVLLQPADSVPAWREAASADVLVDTTGVKNVRPSEVAGRLAGHKVYVHLDLDVLDPTILPAQFAVQGGLSDTGLRTLLGDLKQAAEIVGLEVTAFEAPEDDRERAIRTALVASIVGALL